MNYTIKNEQLTVIISSRGAELQSIRTAEGTEYLWQGDPAYWTSHAPNIFPYVARLTDGKYSLHGNEYGFGNHGLVRYEDLVADNISDRSITFCLDANEETERKYPFDFRYRIRYKLSGCRLVIQTTVENWGNETMYFAVGGHPGFNVPLWDKGSFEDYYLSFDKTCSPIRLGFTEEIFLSGNDSEYSLQDGRVLPLNHNLFDDDAIILKNTAKSIVLKNTASENSLTMSFDGFDYFGIWHMPHTDAPYICLEPWTSLPSRQGIIEELCEKQDMLKLEHGMDIEKAWFLTISEV